MGVEGRMRGRQAMTAPATIRRADIARISNLIEAAQSRGLEVATVVYTAPDGGKAQEKRE